MNKRVEKDKKVEATLRKALKRVAESPQGEITSNEYGDGVTSACAITALYWGKPPPALDECRYGDFEREVAKKLGVAPSSVEQIIHGFDAVGGNPNSRYYRVGQRLRNQFVEL